MNTETRFVVTFREKQWIFSFYEGRILFLDQPESGERVYLMQTSALEDRIGLSAQDVNGLLIKNGHVEALRLVSSIYVVVELTPSGGYSLTPSAAGTFENAVDSSAKMGVYKKPVIDPNELVKPEDVWQPEEKETVAVGRHSMTPEPEVTAEPEPGLDSDEPHFDSLIEEPSLEPEPEPVVEEAELPAPPAPVAPPVDEPEFPAPPELVVEEAELPVAPPIDEPDDAFAFPAPPEPEPVVEEPEPVVEEAELPAPPAPVAPPVDEPADAFAFPTPPSVTPEEPVRDDGLLPPPPPPLQSSAFTLPLEQAVFAPPVESEEPVEGARRLPPPPPPLEPPRV